MLDGYFAEPEPPEQGGEQLPSVETAEKVTFTARYLFIANDLSIILLL